MTTISEYMENSEDRNQDFLIYDMPFEEERYQVSVSVVELTPELAKEMLARNKKNRKVRKNRANVYAEEMRQGRWNFNGDAIRIDSEGNFLDGQHRCLSVVATGVTVICLLVEGLPAGIQETIDQGIARSTADILHFNAEAVPNQVAYAGMARPYLILNGMSPDKADKITVARAVKDNWSVWADSVSLGAKFQRAGEVPGSRGLASAIFQMIIDAGADIVELEEFFIRKVAYGEGVFRGESAYTLRKRLIDSKGIIHTNRAQNIKATYQIFIKSWNAYRNGDELHVLRHNADLRNHKIKVVA